MQIKEHRKNFNQRWKIPSASSYEESFSGFRQKIINIFTSINTKRYGDYNCYFKSIDEIITAGGKFTFCQYYSIQIGQKNLIINRLEQETREIEFYRLIEVVFLSLYVREEFLESTKEIKHYLIKKIIDAIEMSDVNVTVVNIENGIKLYPKGETKLDEELVNKPLSFLNKESNKHFIESLKLYGSNDFRKSAESIYHSLEEFLRHILGNHKGFEQNIEILKKQLKENTCQTEIRNLIFKNFNYLKTYINEYARHENARKKNGDSLGEQENEFLIYQTGLLMRYINKIQEKTAKIHKDYERR